MRAFALAVALLSCACAPASTTRATGAPNTELPPARLPAEVKPLAYVIELRIDPAAKTFSGTERIDVSLPRPARSLWMHAKDLRVAKALASTAGDAEHSVEAKLEQVNADGMARLTFAREVPAGPLALSFEWSADFSRDTAGLYNSREAGESYAATDFEPTAARRVFPSFDEPAFKIPFTLSLVVPARLTAIANTNAAEERDAGDGMKRVRFAATRPLPTYLLALAVGPFELIDHTLPPNAIRATPLRVRYFAPKGRADELAASARFGDAIVPELEHYFGMAYPYEKLDSVAVPGSSGAMENAGLIRYEEGAMLVKPGITPTQASNGVASVMAHETAHQWFGDLVSPPWWDDVWLNESFATWMADRILDRLWPEMGAGDDAVNSGERAMRADSLPSVRAIRKPIPTDAEINSAFDFSTTYLKGGLVIGMFEQWLGDEVFRRGLRAYFTERADGTGSTEQLLAIWSREFGRDIGAPFKTFLDQAGVPQVSMAVRCDGGKASLHLSQGRYVPIGVTAPAAPQKWGIPLCVHAKIGGAMEKACTLFEGREGDLPLSACPDFVVPNIEARGYYRAVLAPPDLRALAKAVPALPARDRIWFGNAIPAALYSGTLPLGEAIDALAPLTADPDDNVASALADILYTLTNRLAADAQLPAVERLAAKLYRAHQPPLAWTPAPHETEKQERLRASMVSTLAAIARDPELRAEAVKRGRAILAPEPPALDRAPAPGPLTALAISAAAAAGDAAFTEQLIARLRRTEREEDRGLVLGGLATVEDPASTDRVLQLELGAELRTNERRALVGGQLYTRALRRRAFAWLNQHLDEVAPEGSGDLLSSAKYVFGFVRELCDPDALEEERAILAPKAAKIVGGSEQLALGTEEARVCIARRKAFASELQRLFGGQ